MSDNILSDKSNQITLTRYTPEQVELIKRTICKGASNDELQMFMYQCNKVGLDPFMRQIWSIERTVKENDTWITTRSCQVSIDGLRLIAERTGRYEGQTVPQWCGEDGKWVDVWVKNSPPLAARVGVYNKGFKEPVYGVARLSSYAQKKKDGSFTKFWATMPDLMLSKCAEALALRKAFPLELSGLYTNEEMGQDDIIPQIKNEAKNNKTKKSLENDKPNYKIETISDEEMMHTYLDKIEFSKSIEELQNSFKEAYKYAKSIKDEKISSAFIENIITLKDMKKEEILSAEDKEEIKNEPL